MGNPSMSARSPTARLLCRSDDSHDPRLSQTAVNGNAPFRQHPGYEIGRALFLKAELRMGVQVTPQRGDARGVGQDGR